MKTNLNSHYFLHQICHLVYFLMLKLNLEAYSEIIQGIYLINLSIFGNTPSVGGLFGDKPSGGLFGDKPSGGLFGDKPSGGLFSQSLLG